ncbi:MAG: LVIVD repeat-containing protein, partial [Solimonas sp.]
TIVSGLRNTHKNFWECDTGIAYLVSGDPAWRTRRMTKIYDLSNPAQPKFIRDYGVAGQQPGSTGTVPTELHGPISLGPKANRVIFAHGTGSNGLVQIVDREKLLNGPKEPTEANLKYPIVTQIDLAPESGTHTALPLFGMPMPEFAKQKPPANRPQPGANHEHGDTIPRLTAGGPHRDFLAIVGESTDEECFENRQFVRMYDVTWEDKPMGVSTWTVPEASGNFCERGGRFGAHSSHENTTPIFYGRLIFVTFFNAGLRVLDIRDPYKMHEVAYYIPATTDKTDERCIGEGPTERCKIAIQSNNAEVDDRGYIYIADRANTGLHIVELTGAARQIANFPGQSTAQR